MISVSSRVFLRSVQALRAHRGVRCVPGVPVQGQGQHVQIMGAGNGAFVTSVMQVKAAAVCACVCVCKLTGGPGGPGGPRGPIIPWKSEAREIIKHSMPK